MEGILKRTIGIALVTGIAASATIPGAGARVYPSDALAVAGQSELGSPPKPPSLPQSVERRQPLEPEVVIAPKDEPLVHEYGVNGVLRAIEVTPANGPSYLLVEAGGDGLLGTRRDGFAPGLLVPAWKVLRW